MLKRLVQWIRERLGLEGEYKGYRWHRNPNNCLGHYGKCDLVKCKYLDHVQNDAMPCEDCLDCSNRRYYYQREK